MRSPDPRFTARHALAAALLLLLTPVLRAQPEPEHTMSMPMLETPGAPSAETTSPPAPATAGEWLDPPLPTGMTLDEVLDAAAGDPPTEYHLPVMDSQIYDLLLVEQLGWRIDDGGPDTLGWDALYWVGGDYHKLVVKAEGGAGFEGPDEGESETDVLYSYLVTPFWSAQAGLQYANAWAPGVYDDTYSLALAVQGLAPGLFEVDASAFLSEDADVSFRLTTSYDVRITQRLVLQPRAEVRLEAQDNRERGLGAGLSNTSLGLRLRYESRREVAPYAGLRYSFASGNTADIIAAEGGSADRFEVVAGVRLSF